MSHLDEEPEVEAKVVVLFRLEHLALQQCHSGALEDCVYVKVRGCMHAGMGDVLVRFFSFFKVYYEANVYIYDLLRHENRLTDVPSSISHKAHCK